MRWIWIDTFVAFDSGRRASAIKNVTLAEDCLHDHFPGYPVFPPTLMIEGMAQTAGILTGEAHDFSDNVILAKIRLAEFSDYARPGDQLRYDGSQIGRVDLIFSQMRPGDDALGLPDHNFVFTDQFMSLLATCRDRTTNGSVQPDES